MVGLCLIVNNYHGDGGNDCGDVDSDGGNDCGDVDSDGGDGGHDDGDGDGGDGGCNGCEELSERLFGKLVVGISTRQIFPKEVRIKYFQEVERIFF